MTPLGDPNAPLVLPAGLLSVAAILVALWGLVRTVRTERLEPVLLHMVAACVMDMFGAFMLRAWLPACLFAMFAALFLWLWWHYGGGRRRMKKWLRKFKPVRRTAPQPS